MFLASGLVRILQNTLLCIYSYLVPLAYLIYIACHVEMPKL